MKIEVLLVSRYANLFPIFISYFEGLGFKSVYATDKDKDGLNMVINEIKPKYLFIASNFYGGGCTPYMVGLLHKNFPKIKITAVTLLDDFPDNMAVWFIMHGAKSYINLADGLDKFSDGIKKILNGGDYISPSVKRIIDGLDEWPVCRLDVTKRQKEILFMICNGTTKEKMCEKLNISMYTIYYHISDLFNIFHVNTREELIRTAYCLDIVKKNNLGFKENKKVTASLPDWARVQMKINKAWGKRK